MASIRTLLAILLCSSVLFAEGESPPVVNTLPTCDSTYEQQVRVITTGASATDCTTLGGNTRSRCRCESGAWVTDIAAGLNSTRIEDAATTTYCDTDSTANQVSCATPGGTLSLESDGDVVVGAGTLRVSGTSGPALGGDADSDGTDEFDWEMAANGSNGWTLTQDYTSMVDTAGFYDYLSLSAYGRKHLAFNGYYYTGGSSLHSYMYIGEAGSSDDTFSVIVNGQGFSLSDDTGTTDGAFYLSTSSVSIFQIPTSGGLNVDLEGGSVRAFTVRDSEPSWFGTVPTLSIYRNAGTDNRVELQGNPGTYGADTVLFSANSGPEILQDGDLGGDWDFSGATVQGDVSLESGAILTPDGSLHSPVLAPSSDVSGETGLYWGTGGYGGTESLHIGFEDSGPKTNKSIDFYRTYDGARMDFSGGFLSSEYNGGWVYFGHTQLGSYITYKFDAGINAYGNIDADTGYKWLTGDSFKIYAGGQNALFVKDNPASPESGAINALRSSTDTQLHVSCQATNTDNCFEVEAYGGGGFAVNPAGQSLFQGGSSSAPSISDEGDENTGFYAYANGEWMYSSNSVNAWWFRSDNFRSASGSGASLLRTGASLTVPGLMPYGSDSNTGLGGDGSDSLSLITAGVNRLEIEPDGDVVVGGGNLDTGGGIRRQVDTYSANQTLTDANHIVVADTDAITLTLPTCTVGQELRIKVEAGSGATITVDGAGSDTIDGNLTINLTDPDAADLICLAANEWGIF